MAAAAQHTVWNRCQRIDVGRWRRRHTHVGRLSASPPPVAPCRPCRMIAEASNVRLLMAVNDRSGSHCRQRVSDHGVWWPVFRARVAVGDGAHEGVAHDLRRQRSRRFVGHHCNHVSSPDDTQQSRTRPSPYQLMPHRAARCSRDVIPADTDDVAREAARRARVRSIAVSRSVDRRRRSIPEGDRCPREEGAGHRAEAVRRGTHRRA